MKKCALIIASLMMVIAVQAKKDEVKIPYDSIPAAARQFVNKNFEGIAVKKSFQRIEEDLPVYTVTLINKTAIEFDMAGGWNSIRVDKKKGDMPRFVVPNQVQESIDGRFGDKKVISIITDGFYYTVKFSDGMETTINANGVVKD